MTPCWIGLCGESGSGLATYYDGSFDGLGRLKNRNAQAAALHIHEADGFNTQSLRDTLGEAPVVLVEIAQRQRGLLLAPGTEGISGFQDLKGRKVVLRQDSAASQHLFDAQLSASGLGRADLSPLPDCARTEEELATALRDGKAEAGFGLGALAGTFGLGFIPTHAERLDLAIWRRAFFDPPMQKLLSFLQSDRFRTRAAEFGGYDITGLGQIHHNGASG